MSLSSVLLFLPWNESLWFFRSHIQNQLYVILLRSVEIWHFYRTLTRGYFFPDTVYETFFSNAVHTRYSSLQPVAAASCSDDRVISAYQMLGEFHQQLPKLSPQRLQTDIDCRDCRSNTLHARHTASFIAFGGY